MRVSLFLVFIFFLKIFGEGILFEFGNFPATPKDEKPDLNSTEWFYRSPRTDAPECGFFDLYGAAAICQKAKEDGSSNYLKKSGIGAINTEHMGFDSYSFIEISDEEQVRGKNTLKYHVTGGKNVVTCPSGNDGPYCYGIGAEYSCKEDYLTIQDPVNISNTLEVGTYFMFFMNSKDVVFPEAKGANRLSMYIKIPDGVDIGEGGYGKQVYYNVDVGPFNNVGGHWYHRFTISGGGWANILIDGHPQHNNAQGFFDGPSGSCNNYDDYFETLYRWYITVKPYNGYKIPPHNMYLDKIEFIEDKEPQNEETISSLGVLFVKDNYFEVTFQDKYSSKNAFSTYEIRYSFNQLTNANYETEGIPCHIIWDKRFYIKNTTNGRWSKWWPYYKNVWARFTLREEDFQKLVPGRKIYFAVKDVSQQNGNSKTPIEAINGYAISGGRDYNAFPESDPLGFDYETDKNELGLIKRISLIIPHRSDETPPNDESKGFFSCSISIFVVFFSMVLFF